MFESHFGLRENPFVGGHQTKFVYPSPEHQEALAHLRFGIENHEPFVLITGEVGTGKTTALYNVLEEWRERVVVALVTNSALTRNELLEEICLRLGFAVEPTSSKPQIIQHLERHLLSVFSKGGRAIVIIDEAQNLDRDLLEEIRLLSNLEHEGIKLLQVFLVGQPELEARLALPELRQLRQRIAVRYRLMPLSADDTQHYIHHRIAVAGGHPSVFPNEACQEVYAASHGIPREINHLCAQALLNAFVEDARAVSPAHVRAATEEAEFQSVLKGETAPPARVPPAAAPRPVETARKVDPPRAAEPPRAIETPRVVAEPPRAVEPPRPSIVEPRRAELEAPPAPAPTYEMPQQVELRTSSSEPLSYSPTAPVERPAPAATPARKREAMPRLVPTLRDAETPPPPRRLPRLDQPIEEEPRKEAKRVRGRDPLADELDDFDPSSATLRWVLAAGVVVVIAVGSLLFLRFGPNAKAAPPQQSEPAPTQSANPGAAQTPPSTEPAPSAAQTPPAATPAPAPATTAPAATKTKPPATTPAPHHAAAPPRASASTDAGTFGVAVGTFLDASRAEEERTRLSTETSLPGELRTVQADSLQSFELVLGAFTNRAAAERAASDLINRGLVDEARVVAQAHPATTPPRP
jgi:type II secretory pathway predicted ATPase ExeA